MKPFKDVKNFGPMLRKLRAQDQLTKAQLAKLTQFSEKEITEIEAGKRLLSEAEVKRIVSAFVPPSLMAQLSIQD
jgi:transcriptional regulator with XRE-family HTH domain